MSYQQPFPAPSVNGTSVTMDTSQLRHPAARAAAKGAAKHMHTHAAAMKALTRKKK